MDDETKRVILTVMNARLVQKKQKMVGKKYKLPRPSHDDQSDWVPQFPLSVIQYSTNIEGGKDDWELRGSNGELLTLARHESGRKFLVWVAETLNRERGFAYLYE